MSPSSWRRSKIHPGPQRGCTSCRAPGCNTTCTPCFECLAVCIKPSTQNTESATLVLGSHADIGLELTAQVSAQLRARSRPVPSGFPVHRPGCEMCRVLLRCGVAADPLSASHDSSQLACGYIYLAFAGYVRRSTPTLVILTCDISSRGRLVILFVHKALQLHLIPSQLSIPLRLLRRPHHIIKLPGRYVSVRQ